MIRELKMRRLDLDLRHVTRGAILIRHGTARSITCLGSRFSFQRMTRQALLVVISRILF